MNSPPLLICLDLQPSGLAAESPTGRRLRIAAARQVIDRARAADWEVTHACREDLPQPASPLAGLRPLPCEAVYRRDGISAFDARHFPELLERRRTGTATILSFDIGCAALVTALTAVARGNAVDLLTDAAGDSEVVEAARGVARVSGHGRLRLRRFCDLPIPGERGLMLAANQP